MRTLAYKLQRFVYLRRWIPRGGLKSGGGGAKFWPCEKVLLSRQEWP